MALETGNYISDLVITNPTGADAKSTSDDHHRLIKKTIKQSLPNISGQITASHTELSYVTGVTSAIQTQINAKVAAASPALTGTPTAPTATPLTNSTQLATTAYTDSAVAVEAAARIATDALKAPSASPALTGVPTAPTAAPGTNSTQIATTAFAAALAIAAGNMPIGGSAGQALVKNSATNYDTSWVTLTAGDHEVRVEGANGFGSTNTNVARYTTTVRNVGTAVTYTDSATLGASFTINEDGLYSIYAQFEATTNSTPFSVTRNASGITVPTGADLLLEIYVIYTARQDISRTLRLSAGDVVRVKYPVIANSISPKFIITKVGL